MIKKYSQKRDTRKFYRVNERIFANSLRVLDAQGKQIGVMTRSEALDFAKRESLDLVEIAPLAKPPVAKVINFKKLLYQEEKKKREEKKKSKATETKEVRLGPFMNSNDLSVMTKRASGFLKDGNKVRLVVYFSGRQIVHPEFGHEVLNKALDELSNFSKVDRDRRLEGRKLITLLSPDKKGTVTKTNEKENQEVSI